MPNRYTRDELIKISLDMSQLPNLVSHDMPNGVVQQDAFSIQWLQDILDFWYHMVPFSATVTNAALNATANSDSIALPADFILDVRNGYLVESVPGDTLSMKRTHRVPLQKWLNRKLAYQRTENVQYPTFYNIQGYTIKITPTPNINVVGRIWYYQLPAVLNAGDRPLFPNDYVCVEYLRIRALEWARVYEPGTSQKFCDKIVAGMKAAGLMNEPEDDEIPFDDIAYRPQSSDTLYTTYGWMGPR